MGAKVEDLTPKTNIQSYYEHDYESFLAVLKNRKKLAVDPARRQPAEALRAEFEGSIGKLLQLLGRIVQTEELIDRAWAVRADAGGCGPHCKLYLPRRDLEDLQHVDFFIGNPCYERLHQGGLSGLGPSFPHSSAPQPS